MNLNELPLRLRLTDACGNDDAFEDSYLEPGMLVNLIAVNRCREHDDPANQYNAEDLICFELVVDASPFYDFNVKLMPDAYYSNRHTPKDTNRSLFTAIEAGYYHPRQSLYYYIPASSADPMESLSALVSPLFNADIPDSVAVKTAAASLIASHERLREALTTILGNENNLMLRDLLEEASSAENSAKEVFC